MIDDETRANGDKEVVIAQSGKVFFGGEEFKYPILKDSISIRPGPMNRHNLLTLTLIVGSVVSHPPIVGVEPPWDPAEDEE